MKIKITCKGSKLVHLNELSEFQGNLKELNKIEFEKIKNSIKKHGFSFPVFVWGDQILDGHQRVFTVKKMVEAGDTIGKVPVVEIEADNETHAAEKLLLINSRFAKITEDGLYEFVNLKGVDLSAIAKDIDLPDINMSSFIDNYFGGDGDGGSGDGGSGDGGAQLDGLEYQIIVECKSEAEQMKFLSEFEERNIPCRPLIL